MIQLRVKMSFFEKTSLFFAYYKQFFVDKQTTMHYNTLDYYVKQDRGGNLIPSQMLKGTLEGCILAIIGRRETYGYEIAETLGSYGFGRIAEGTIYPLLLRLEKNGLVHTEYRASLLGPKRMYYSLSEAGKKELAGFVESYREMENAVNRLLKEEKCDE